MAETLIPKQLDKLTNDIHRRTIHRVDWESKHLVVHSDFSQDHTHAMVDQSMCELFEVISSLLFIAIAHFWDAETDQLECEGWIYISDNTSHSDNPVNHYLQWIHSTMMFFMFSKILVISLPSLFGLITALSSLNLSTSWDGLSFM